MNQVLVGPSMTITPQCQGGFCKGRQFACNSVVLDTFMWVYNRISSFPGDTVENCQLVECASPTVTPGRAGLIEDCPITALYDICNAFPSIAHLWLLCVLLECLGINPRLLRVIRLLYHNSNAYSHGIGNGHFLFRVLAGVRTGCPLSATLFLLSLYG